MLWNLRYYQIYTCLVSLHILGLNQAKISLGIHISTQLKILFLKKPQYHDQFDMFQESIYLHNINQPILGGYFILLITFGFGFFWKF